MTVAVPSTPANYFHLLRLQAKRSRRKPMVVFTPKSILRSKAATSPAAEFTSGTFRPVIDDTVAREGITRVVLCSGKVYYDLLAARRKREDGSAVALVRVEQLYPLPASRDQRGAGLLPRPAGRGLGAGGAGQHGRLAVHRHQPARAPRRPGRCAGSRVRPVPSPSAGSSTVHEAEQAALVDAALQLVDGPAVYFTDRGIEELDARRGEEQVSLAWLAERLREFVDLNPEFEVPVDRLATWLARDDQDSDE